MPAEKLTDSAIAKAKVKDRPYYLRDGKRLSVLVSVAGSKTWIWGYRAPDGRDRVYTIGPFSEWSAVKARDRRRELEKLVESGLDPKDHEVQQAVKVKVQNATLWPVALEWLSERKKDWSPYYYGQAVRFLERYVRDGIGKLPIREIQVPDIRALLKSIADRESLGLTKAQLEARGELKAAGAPHIAIRVRHHLTDIFAHALETGNADTNPAAALRSSKVIKTGKARNNARLSEKQLGELLVKLDSGGGTERTRIGIKLLLLLMCRTAELRKARWSEFDLDKGLWSIPAERMKMKVAHVVPLSTQSIAELRRLQQISPVPKHGPDWLFPNMKDPKRYGDANTFNHSLVRLGFGGGGDSPWFRAHGARGTASTLLNSRVENPDGKMVKKYPSEVIEASLAHAIPGTKGDYDGSTYLPERRIMLQQWADYLDSLRIKKD